MEMNMTKLTLVIKIMLTKISFEEIAICSKSKYRYRKVALLAVVMA
jgi:hypothetical protein